MPHGRDIVFHPDKLEFSSYPFLLASISKNSCLRAEDIREIRLSRMPIEIVTQAGEVLFAPVFYKSFLELFGRLNNIPLIDRIDVWAEICEPFLDTTFDEEHQQGTIAKLIECGFTEEEISVLRNEVQAHMLRYNSVHWEWVHLGHDDLLRVFNHNSRRVHFARNSKLQYERWNEISNKGKIQEFFHKIIEEQVSSKLWDFVSSIQTRRGVANDPFDQGLFRAKLSFAEKLTSLILARYGEAHRRYHGLKHVLNVVSCSEQLSIVVLGKVPVALLAAAWFHDIVYDGKSGDNEEQSADLMKSILKDWLSAEDLEEARELILMTKSHFNATTVNQQLLADADLHIFCEEESVYCDYMNSVRQEYAHVGDADFAKGRLRFIENLLAKINETGKLFNFLDPMHEAQACHNIQREKADLLRVR